MEPDDAQARAPAPAPGLAGYGRNGPSVTMLRISTDPATLDVPMIHHFLSTQSTWARDIPLAVVQASLRHSLCFAGFIDTTQVAFARVITDQATFAYLADVFVLPQHRGLGYAAELIGAVVADARLREHAGQHGDSGRRQDRSADMRDDAGHHRADMHVEHAGGGLAHGVLL